jgi:cytochrome P450
VTGGGFPRAGLADDVRFNLLHVLPNVLQGLFSRRPRWVGLFGRLGTDRRTVRLAGRLRDRHGAPAVWVRLLASRALLLFDVDAVRRVLDRSPEVYADPPLKRRGMSHFQPGAVTISRGDDWRRRRRFNEEVLDSPRRIHRLADRFAAVAREESGEVLREADGRLGWDDLERLFARLTRRVVFGGAARNDAELTGRLGALMREANRLVGLGRSRHFAPFYERLRGYLQAAEPGSLVSLAAGAEAGNAAWVETQVPHWTFAAKDTLAVNAARALALVVSHPDDEARVRAELAAAGGDGARRIDGLAHLEGCVHEAMRLWPTTPLLSRLALQDDELAGGTVPAGTQVLILNLFHHRDPATVPDADAFVPGRWRDTAPDYRFNHLSNGPQSCAGAHLAVFLAKATLAALLEGGHYTLLRPKLDPSRPLPHALDPYVLHFAVQR